MYFMRLQTYLFPLETADTYKIPKYHTFPGEGGNKLGCRVPTACISDLLLAKASGSFKTLLVSSALRWRSLGSLFSAEQYVYDSYQFTSPW
jgi:hypothetical protein